MIMIMIIIESMIQQYIKYLEYIYIDNNNSYNNTCIFIYNLCYKQLKYTSWLIKYKMDTF